MTNTLYHRSIAVAAALAVVLAVVGFAGAAEKPNKGVKLGDPVPDFTMKDLDGQQHTLSEHKGKPVVLVFVSNGCPWSRGADPVLSEIDKEYRDKGVVFLGIDPDANNTPEQIKDYAQKNKVTYTILKDERNRYADALGAQQTPEVYIVDKNGVLVYHGAVDDRKTETQEGETNYVRAALDEILAEKPVSTPEKKQWGCTIKRVEPSEAG